MSSELFKKRSMRSQYNNQALSEKAKSFRDTKSDIGRGIELESIENLKFQSREESPINGRTGSKMHSFNNTEFLNLR